MEGGIEKHEILFNSLTSDKISLIVRSMNRCGEPIYMQLVMVKHLKSNEYQYDAAEYIKSELDEHAEFMDKRCKGPWHCVVGSSFSAAVSHSNHHAAVVRFPEKGWSVWIHILIVIVNRYLYSDQ